MVVTVLKTIFLARKRNRYSGLMRLRRLIVPTPDWSLSAKQLAPAPHLARPEGRAALTHMCQPPRNNLRGTATAGKRVQP